MDILVAGNTFSSSQASRTYEDMLNLVLDQVHCSPFHN